MFQQQKKVFDVSLFGLVNCTAGTFLNKDTGKCDDCPIGTYQGLSAQEMCVTCPPRTSTTDSRTVNISSCLGK